MRISPRALIPCKNLPKGKINPKLKEHNHKHIVDQKYDQYDNAYAYDVHASDVQD